MFILQILSKEGFQVEGLFREAEPTYDFLCAFTSLRNAPFEV